MFTVYVLYSLKHNKIYIGYSADLEQRMISHNEKATNGYTFNFRPWVVAHTEVFDSKKDAIIREKELKSARGRKFIWDDIVPRYKSTS